MSHSPAPWTVQPSQRADRHVLGIVDANEQDIVITDSGYYPPTLEDARLIAAAPDLLAACQYALEWNQMEGAYIEKHITDVLNAAIQKAEGR